MSPAGISSEGREALRSALDELQVDRDAVYGTGLLWRVASLVATISPDDAVKQLAGQFRPLIESHMSRGRGRGNEPGMIAMDGGPLYLPLSEDPEARLMFTPHGCGPKDGGFVTGRFERPAGGEPVSIVSDVSRGSGSVDVDPEDGTVDATLPVWGTTKDADYLSDDDFALAGSVRIDGTFYAPPAELFRSGVPQVQIADVDLDVPPRHQHMETGFTSPFMHLGLFGGGGIFGDGLGTTYEDCVESSKSGRCTNHGASCEAWGAKCTTIGVTWPIEFSSCVCMIRP